MNSTNYSEAQTHTQPKQDELPSEELIRIAASQEKLRIFVEEGWHVLEPKTPFKAGWHLDAICDHLQAVHTGQIQNLLINIPPRHMKSLAVAVFFPAWEWIEQPYLKYLCSSYAEQLSKRDSVKCRRLIQSLWYQARWGSSYQIASDQNEKMRFENDKTGYRVATSTTGMGTGEGGDRIINDDPHNVMDGESVVKRQTVLTQWDESMSTRLNDEDTGAKIIMMQRVHGNDLSGHVLEKEHGYVHLCLPARYEGKSRISLSPVINEKTGTIWEDPRTEVGEALWPAKFNIEQLDKRESKMSKYAVAGQHQQTPAPRGGGMIEVGNLIIIERFLHSQNVIKSVRYWDKAATEDGGTYTAGVLMHQLKEGCGAYEFVIVDVVHGQWGSNKREKRIRQTAILDGKKITIWVEQEPGGSGKESVENTIRKLKGYRAKADRVTGEKTVRAEPFADQVEIGNVAVLRCKWTKDFIDECESFPVGRYKDQVDAAGGAFNKLVAKQKRSGTF